MPRLKVFVVAWGPLVGPVVELVRPWPCYSGVRGQSWDGMSWHWRTLATRSQDVPRFRRLVEMIVFLMSFCFSKARINSHPFHYKTKTSLHCVLQLFTLSNLTKLPYWSPHYARNRSGSYLTPWPSRKWHLPRSPYPLPEPLVEWSHGGAGSESKSWNLSWQQPHEHNASKVLEKGVEKSKELRSSQNHVILPIGSCWIWHFILMDGICLQDNMS